MKEYTVRWTKLAKKDVVDVRKFISLDSSWYAKSVVAEIVIAARDIGRHPKVFTICPEWKSDKTRHRLVHGYRIIFDIKVNSVVILGVIHEKRLLTNASNKNVNVG